jgi:hypothetical protein
MSLRTIPFIHVLAYPFHFFLGGGGEPLVIFVTLCVCVCGHTE